MKETLAGISHRLRLDNHTSISIFLAGCIFAIVMAIWMLLSIPDRTYDITCTDGRSLESVTGVYADDAYLVYHNHDDGKREYISGDCHATRTN